MTYDLMLLADPGPERAVVLRTLQEAPDVHTDTNRADRFWLRTPLGEAQINIGSKDPVESVHVAFELGKPALTEVVARRTLTLGDALGMRLDDVQWGKEVRMDDVPELVRHCDALASRPAPELVAQAATVRPWWKFW